MLTTKLMLADFLSREDGPEYRCEFVDGEIIELPPEIPQNNLVSEPALVMRAAAMATSDGHRNCGCWTSAHS